MQKSVLQFWAVALIPVFLIADQFTKALILAEPRFNALGCLDMTERCGQIPLPGPIDFTMLWNRGMSYGLLQSEGIMRWVLSGVMLAIAIGFFIWLLRAEGRLLKLALSMVVGGAFGNLIDRVRFGAVLDFIDASALHFPWVFNVADSAISVGAVLLFVDQFLLSGKKQAKTLTDDI
jgi:signal peptidase II